MGLVFYVSSQLGRASVQLHEATRWMCPCARETGHCNRLQWHTQELDQLQRWRLQSMQPSDTLWQGSGSVSVHACRRERVAGGRAGTCREGKYDLLQHLPLPRMCDQDCASGSQPGRVLGIVWHGRPHGGGIPQGRHRAEAACYTRHQTRPVKSMKNSDLCQEPTYCFDYFLYIKKPLILFFCTSSSSIHLSVHLHSSWSPSNALSSFA